MACSLTDSCSASSISTSFNASNLANSSSTCSALNLFCSIDSNDSLSNFAFVNSVASFTKALLFICCSYLNPVTVAATACTSASASNTAT